MTMCGMAAMSAHRTHLFQTLQFTTAVFWTLHLPFTSDSVAVDPLADDRNDVLPSETRGMVLMERKCICALGKKTLQKTLMSPE